MKKIILLVILLLPYKVFAYSTSATSTIVMDTDNKRILYSNNIHEKRGVASISKIMTALVTIENININKKVIIGDEIDNVYGSFIYVTKGEELTIKDLLYGLLLRSGNDAASTLAVNVGGSIENFVYMMNKKAKELGMNDTHFNNPTGLDDDGGNISSAYDMAILTSYAVKNDIYKEISGTKTYTLKTNKNTYSWTNKNKLLHNLDYVTGGKTGFTDKARRTLVTTASKDNMNLVIVTLNDVNDFKDHKNLYEETFNNYNSYKILKSGYLNVLDDDYYNEDTLYINKDFNYILKKNEIDSMILKINLVKKNSYKTGDKVGVLDVNIGDKKVYSEDIYVKKKVKVKKNILNRIKDIFK